MNILFALTRFPRPGLTGDRLRALKQIEFLSQRHNVHVVCMTEGPVEAGTREVLEELCVSVDVVDHPKWRQGLGVLRGALSGLPGQVLMYRSAPMAAAMERVIRQHDIDVVVAQFARVAENVPVVPGARLAIDFIDSLSLIMGRRAASSRLPMRLVYDEETRRLRRYEAKLVREYDLALVTSPVDRQALGDEVSLLGVGFDESLVAEALPPTDAGKDVDVLFTGNLGYASNITSAKFLVEEVMSALPDLRVALVGARPAAKLVALRSERVRVEGPVDDLGPWFARARIFVAPMLVGGGLQLKLLEAMASGLPVVTTTVANSALGADPGSELVVADDAGAMADAVRALLDDPDRALAIARAGQRYVLDNYRWSDLNHRLEQLLQPPPT